jgi:hypothetical protein
MTNKKSITFRVRDKGGKSGGNTLSGDVPEFNPQAFMATANATEFLKKVYFSAVKKIIREIEDGKNKTSLSDLESFETIITRSMAFTQAEIKEWIETRDWTRANTVKDMGKLLPIIQADFPKLANRKHRFSRSEADKLADKVIAAVADDPDPIADFLFSVLTTHKTPDDIGDVL